MRRSGFVGLGVVLAPVLALAVFAAPRTATAKFKSRPVWVTPGHSIQAAIDAADPGDTINVLPGDYTESPSSTVALHITKPLALIAKSGPRPFQKVRILAAPGQEHGILAEPAAPGDPDIDGLLIKGFTVENFQNNGIWLRHVKNFTIEDNQSVNNLENGIFPTLSANGLVTRNVSYGSQDSALWVEASENVRVVDNELYHAPTGLEITISKEVTVERNDIHDNSVGVGLYHPNTAGLPESQWPPYYDDGSWHIRKNHVHDNNTANTASEGSETAALPYGGGILLLGVHDIDVQKNLIKNNDFFGIAVINYCIAVLGTPFNCDDNPPPADPRPAHDLFAKNTLVDNHGAPPPPEEVGLFNAYASDILELVDYEDIFTPGTAPTTDCYVKNKIRNTPPLAPRTLPDPLPGC
jgi:parallel beta-helix repeat protein